MASRQKDWALDVLADRFTSEPFTRAWNEERARPPGRAFSESLGRMERGMPKIPFEGMVVRIYSRDDDNGQSRLVEPGLLHGFIQSYRRGQPYRIAIASEFKWPISTSELLSPCEVRQYEVVIVRVTDKHWQETTFALVEPGYCPPVALKRSDTELFL